MIHLPQRGSYEFIERGAALDNCPYKSPETDSNRAGEKSGAVLPWRAGVAIVLFLIYLGWQIVMLAGSTPLEGLAFSGGLISFENAKTPRDFMLGLAICVPLITGMLAFPIRPRAGTFVLSLVSLLIWFRLSYLVASGAAC